MKIFPLYKSYIAIYRMYYGISCDNDKSWGINGLVIRYNGNEV